MNNVFRLIWNRTLGRLVVTSEAARSRDKAATRQGGVGQLPAPEAAVSGVPALLRPAVIAVALAAGSMVLVAPEARAVGWAGGTDCVGGTSNIRIAIGQNAQACHDWSTAIGAGAITERERSVAIGSNARVAVESVGNLRVIEQFADPLKNSVAQDYMDANGGNQLSTFGVAMGDKAYTEGGISIGRHSKSIVRGIAIGHLADSDDAGMALGNAAVTKGIGGLAVSWGAAAIGRHANAIGRVSVAEGESAIAFGTSATALGDQAIAIGSDNDKFLSYQDDQLKRTQAEGARAIALGTHAQSLSDDAIAMGTKASAEGDRSVAVGDGATANNIEMSAIALVGASNPNGYSVDDALPTTAVGAGAQALSGTAIGHDAVAGKDIGPTVNTGTAVGAGAQATGNVSIAISPAAYAPAIADGLGAIAMGFDARANEEQALALGVRAEAGQDSVAVGYGTQASGLRSLAAGRRTEASAEDTIAFGTDAEASATNAIAIGKDSLASGVDTGAIGRGAVATGSWAVGTGANASNGGQAFGEFSTASGADSSAYGHTATATGDRSSALGTEASTGGDFATAVGYQTDASGDKSYAGGYLSSAQGVDSSAIGAGVVASGEAAVVIGRDAVASGLQSFAVGHNTDASGQDAVALGTAAEASGLSSIAISRGAYALADYATALGGESNANAEFSTAIGSFSVADAESATAIGDLSRAEVEGSVALGSESVADTAAGVAGYVPFGATAVDTSAIEGTVAQRAAVDIGSRQITSVAAGTELDDAVNVSQLIAAQSKVVAGTGVAEVAVTDNPDGGTIYTINADGTTASAGSTAVTVDAVGPDANNLTDYVIDLSNETKDSLENANKGWNVQTNGDAATNVAPGGTVQFIDGKNIAITRDGTDITVATADDVEFTNVKITNQLDVAGDTNIGGNTTIEGDTTVKGDTYLGDNFSVVNNEAFYDGPINNDNSIVNKQYVDGIETHYYSVNDNGVQQGNYDNDGATGRYSLAAGTNAVASDDYAVAVGDKAEATGFEAIAIGREAVASGRDSSIALGQLSEASGNFAIAIGRGAAAEEDNSVALGNGAISMVEQGVALGSGSLASVGSGVAGYVPEGADADDEQAILDTIATRGAVDLGSRQITSVAAGTNDDDAVNVSQLKSVSNVANKGWYLSANGEDTDGFNIAPGEAADFTEGKNIEITRTDGSIEVATADDVEFTTVEVSESITVGDTFIDGDSVTTNNITVNENLTVEGDTFLNENLTVAGNTTINENLTVEGDTYLGDNFSIVNNEAFYDGPITENNHIVNKEYVDGGIGDLADTPITFGGDTGTTERKLGDELNIVTSNANLSTEVTDDKTLVIALSDDLDVNNVTVNDSLTVNGPTTLNGGTTIGDSLTLQAGTTVNMGGNQITNVAAGTEGDHAVNLDQLTDVSDVANKGWNLQANDDADVENIGPGETAIFEQGQNIAINREDNKIIVATADDVEFTNVEITNQLDVAGDTNIGGNTTIEGDTTVKGDTFLGDNFSVVNNEAFYDGPITENTHIVNKEYVDGGIGDLADTPITFGGDTGTTERKLGEQLNIVTSNANLSTEVTDDETLEIALSDDLNLDSVTINNGGPVINENGINMNDNRITNVGGPVDGGDALNLDYFNANRVRYYSVNDAGTQQGNYNNDGATGINALAAGTNAFAIGHSSVAVGDGALADGDSSVAVGDGAETASTGDSQVAIGDGAFAGGNQSIAIGEGAQSGLMGQRSVAIGQGAVASRNDAIASGTGAQATERNSVAIGLNASSTHQGSIALGAGSVANGSTLGTAAYQPLDTDGNPIAVAAPTAGSEVSVGSAGNERRITNVAAGAEDTDAVNVSQLKAVNEVASSGWNLQANDDADVENIGPGETAIFEQGQNIAINREDNKIIVATADDVEFTNVEITNQLDVAGDTNIGGNTTIEGDTTVKGDTYLGDNFSVVNNEAFYDGPITENTHIVNKEYVDGGLNNPLTFGANEGDDTERRLGDRLDIVGEEDAEGDSNIITKLTDEETLELALNDDLKIGNSITVG
ncbi:ESPR-type extended signal peptide-containing protein, partial [Vreelandella alkaliphila]